MNDMVFRTGGDWDSTTLFNNGFEVMAAQLFVELRAGRDEYDEPVRGGIYEGTDLTALVRPQENPDAPYDVLPGRLTLIFPAGQVVLENAHPGVYLDQTRVFLNGDDITDRIVDLYVDINAVDDVVSAWLTIYKSRFFLRDEVITHTFL